MTNFSWLHLSDWHQRGEDFDRRVVRDALLADIRDRGNIDPRLTGLAFIVFSGDAAFSGIAAEFEAARENLFDPVLAATTLGPEHLHIVPGNHDLNRKTVTEMLPTALQQPFASEALVNNWLGSEQKCTRALEPFADYSQFVTTYTGQTAPDFASIRRLAVEDQQVALLGLNSAWMCGRNQDGNGQVNDYGFLNVGEPQIHDALASIEDADLRIAVVHHPFSWLQGFERSLIEERLKRICHFILHGHEHEPNFDLTRGVQGECAIIPAGACYDRRKATDPRYVNAYNLVHVDLATGKGVLFFRRWSERQTKWIEDSDTCAGGKQGFKLPKQLGRPRPSPRRKSRSKSPSPAVTDYLARLAEQTSRLNLVGMGRSFQIDLPIAEAYVPLRTKLHRSLEEQGTDRFQDHQAEFERDVDLGEVFREAERLDKRGVVLLGEPGSGKTTGARQIAWRLASGQSPPRELGLPDGITPVLLRFRNLSRAALGERKGLRQFLLDETKCPLAGAGLDEPCDELLRCRHGLLWILDGLDEVIDPTARAEVSRWVKQAIDQRVSDRFLVTCRFAGYYRDGVSLGAPFVEFHVRALDDVQIEHFVHDWFRAAYKQLNKLTQAESRAQKLLAVLARPEYQSRKLRELCTNPLMLSILCIVFHDEQQDLPRDRAELYAHCVLVLLQYWRRELYQSELGSKVQPFDADAAQTVLARIAWWLHSEKDRESATLDELAAQASLGLARVSASCGLGQDGLAFIQRMKDETGILASDNDGRCGFLHLSFQEYLAADHAARQGLAKELASRVTDSWWLEVALLSLRRFDSYCEAFFRELLAAGIAEDRPEVADRCLSEAKFFSAVPFLEALEQAVSPRRIANVLRLLRDRAEQVPELAEIAQRLAAADDRETRAFAREILGRLNVMLPQAADERKVIVDDRTGMTLVEIPAGEFDMGAEKSDRDNERPVHRVHISRSFWLGKYPVTNAQYAQFMKDAEAKVKEPKYWEDRRFNQPEQPVVGVSWDDAQAFCEWAGCRLPTEAEWEYACRAGTTTEYSFGDDQALLGEYGWFGENSGGQTQPVGTKQPNGWDLHDMHGNVWEWCQDWFGAYPNDPQTDPTGPESGEGRVLRGGSWYLKRRICRSAIRDNYQPENRLSVNGFRVART